MSLADTVYHIGHDSFSDSYACLASMHSIYKIDFLGLTVV